ncbi:MULTISPECIES: hypothetical protein [unclassified Yoonia]|uniref:hypothetical protein n=1 Tax=unclassified Yoonia TaxID=2629118 RepID=UPI002B002328|nr:MULTISPECIES: hypothetical protein [unclassified Yoonia]
MTDSKIVLFDSKLRDVDLLDALAIANMPQLIERLELTAYALARRGDTKLSNVFFWAVAIAESSKHLEPNCKSLHEP